MHNKMVMLVDRMLELNKKKVAEKNPGILQQLETQITATDKQIDQLVYELNFFRHVVPILVQTEFDQCAMVSNKSNQQTGGGVR